MTARSTVLRGLLGLSYYMGGPVFSDMLRRTRCMILIYHGITNRDHFEGVSNYYGYSIPLREFEQHLLYLKRRCNVISLQNLITGTGLSSSKTNVILSFDDGYENHYFNVFRLLQRYDMTAVLALPTAFVCGQEPLWDDVIEYAVNHCRKQQVCLYWQGKEHAFALNDFRGRLKLYNWLLRQAVQVSQHEREPLIQAALHAMEVCATAEAVFANEDYRPLTQEEIEEMANSGRVTFASHSVNHYLLAKCDLETMRTELADSKRQVEELTGRACSALCLPGGSYSIGVLEEAFQAGYDYVLTSDAGPIQDGRRVLNRNGVFREHHLHRFADMVHGPVLEILQTTRRARGRLRGISN